MKFSLYLDSYCENNIHRIIIATLHVCQPRGQCLQNFTFELFCSRTWTFSTMKFLVLQYAKLRMDLWDSDATLWLEIDSLRTEKGRSGVSLSCVVARKMMMELHIEHLLECVGVIWTIYYAAVIQEIMTHETSMWYCEYTWQWSRKQHTFPVRFLL